MDQTALVREQIEGGEKLIRKLIERGFELWAGLWTKMEYDSKSYLYLISPQVEKVGLINAYRKVSAAQIDLEKSGLHWMEQIEQFTVKLIPPSDPLAEEILTRYQQYPDMSPAHAHGWRYSSSLVEGGFAYPSSLFHTALASTP